MLYLKGVHFKGQCSLVREEEEWLKKKKKGAEFKEKNPILKLREGMFKYHLRQEMKGHFWEKMEVGVKFANQRDVSRA